MKLETIKSKNDWNIKKVTQSKQIHAQAAIEALEEGGKCVNKKDTKKS